MSKDSSAIYDQNKKDIKVSLKKKRKSAIIWLLTIRKFTSSTEDEKQKLVEYRKKYYKMRKKALL